MTVVQPRWGNRVTFVGVTQGTRQRREPWALESNAFGVGAMGHIDIHPSQTRS